MLSINFRNRLFPLPLLFLLLLFLIPVCSSGAEQDNVQTTMPGISSLLLKPSPKIISRTVFMNPTDSILYQFSLSNGEEFTYFGRRNDNGLPSAITMLNHRDESGMVYTILFDAHGLPAKILDEQGLELTFNYNLTNPVNAGTNSFFGSAGNPMGVESINTLLSISDQKAASELQTQMRLGQHAIVDLNQAYEEVLARDPVGNLYIQFTKCGEPVYPEGEVFVRYKPNSRFTFEYPAKKTGIEGMYVSSIPQRTVNPLSTTLETACTAFADGLDASCKIYEPTLGGPLSDPVIQQSICTNLALRATIIGTPLAGAKTLAACETLITTHSTACKHLGYSSRSADPMADNIIQTACDQVEETLEPRDSTADIYTVAIQAIAKTPSGAFASDERVISSYGPFPQLDIRSSRPSIDQLTMLPKSPAQGQQYSITTKQSCANRAEVSVSRDDRDIAFEAVALPGSSQQGSVTVTVPGTPIGKVDTLSATAVNLTTGLAVKRTRRLQYPPAVISVNATDASASENGDNGTFTLTRSGPVNDEQAVAFSLSGSASLGGDYTPTTLGAFSANLANFPAGASSTTVTIRPVDDALLEGEETVVLTLTTPSHYGYTIGKPSRATVTLQDNDADTGTNCLNVFSYMAIGGDIGQIQLSGDPDYPTIRWSMDDGSGADELYIVSERHSDNVYHLIATEKSAIPKTVQHGEYGYPNTQPGQYCHGKGEPCTNQYPIERGLSHEIWVHSSGQNAQDLKMVFQIFGLKDGCSN